MYASDLTSMKAFLQRHGCCIGPTGKTGCTGPTGPTGITGSTGPIGYSSGLHLYLDSPSVSPPEDNGQILRYYTGPVPSQSCIVYDFVGASDNTPHRIATFQNVQGVLIDTLIPQGVWDMKAYFSAANLTNPVSFCWNLYYTDPSGANPVIIANGQNNKTVINSSIIKLFQNSLSKLFIYL